MRRLRNVKFAALLLVVAMLAFSMTACGSKGSSAGGNTGDAAAADENAGEGTATDDVGGEEYDTGLFTVLAPEGWLAAPQQMFGSEENDPTQVNIFKGAASADSMDIYGKAYIKITYQTDSEYMLSTSVFESYEELEPIEIGGRTWNAVEGEYDSSKHLMVLYTTEGTGYISADLWMKVYDESFNLNDPDVQAILSSITID